MRKHCPTIIVATCIFSAGLVAQEPAEERPKRTTVYKTDFDKNYDPQPWTRKNTKGILGDVKYHGPYFSYDWGSFNLSKLEAHRFVRVKATLVIAGTLDGHHPKWGPDNWAIGADRSGIIFLTSFANDTKGKKGDVLKRQSFPDEIFAGSHPPGTGSTATNVLDLQVDSKHADAFANADNSYPSD